MAPATVDFRQLTRGPEAGGVASVLERPAVDVKRRLVGVGVLGAVAGAHEVPERLRPVLALVEVVRQLLVVLGETVRVELLDRVADGTVELLASLLQQAVVGDVLDHGVLEDVGRLVEEPELVDDLELFQFEEQPLQSVLEPADTLEQTHEELPPDHRGELDPALAVVAEPGGPRPY